MAALDDAEAFLGKMRKSAVHSEQVEFELNLRALLATIRSIPDHLLEEYNLRFGFNIPLSDRHFKTAFSLKAKADSRKEVAEFLTFWTQGIESIRSNVQNPANILFSKRHIQIHRAPVRPDLTKIEMHEGNIGVTESVTVQKYNDKGELVATSHSTSTTMNQPSPSSSHVDWYFKDHDGEPVLQLCEEGLNVVKVFVNAAHNRFP